MSLFDDELKRYMDKESKVTPKKDWNICEICNGKIITRCRCMGPHDLASLAKGHGRLCENGHRLGDNCYIVDKEAAERYKKFK